MAALYPRVTEADAVDWVTREAQATSEPCLTAEDILGLVRAARRADSEDRAPSDAAWEPTYDLHWAAWKAWRLKAGKAVLMVDVNTEGGGGVKKSQVREACLMMAAEYARGVLVAMPLAADAGEAAYGLEVPGTTMGPDNIVQPDEMDDDE